MKAFIKRQKPQKHEEVEQKFKFRFECEFELTAEDIFVDPNIVKKKITVEDVIERMEDEFCDEVQFINNVIECSLIDACASSLDVAEITEPKEEDKFEILSEGIMAEESTSLDEAVNMVAENVRTLAH